MEVSNDLLHVLGCVSNLTVQFMIDSGATHNFMSITQCKRLGVVPEKGRKI